jgi:TIR domain
MTIQPAHLEPTGPQVFLSHKTSDRPVVEWVAAQVEAMGIRCWIAEENPHAGAALSAKVQRAISESVGMIALLTEAGHSSAYVQQEIGAAVRAGVPVLPLVDKDLDRPTLGMLDGIEYIVIDRNDLGSSSASLIMGLRTLAEAAGADSVHATATSSPAIQVQLNVQIQLTPGDLLVGLLILAAITGLIVIAAQSGGGQAAGGAGPG